MRNRTVTACVVGALVALHAPLASGADVCRWKGANGVTTYGDCASAPKNRETVKVDESPRSSSAPPPAVEKDANKPEGRPPASRDQFAEAFIAGLKAEDQESMRKHFASDPLVIDGFMEFGRGACRLLKGGAPFERVVQGGVDFFSAEGSVALVKAAQQVICPETRK